MIGKKKKKKKTCLEYPVRKIHVCDSRTTNLISCSYLCFFFNFSFLVPEIHLHVDFEVFLPKF